MAILCVRSESNGILIFSSPPSFLGVFIHAKCVNCESTDAATTSTFSFLNSSTRSENARISVGQTNVLKVLEKNIRYNRILMNWLLFNLQIKRVKKEHQVFSFEVRQFYLFEFASNHSCAFPIRCLLSD